MESNIYLGPKAKMVVNAALQELSPALESIIAKICTASGYQDQAGAQASVTASLSSTNPVPLSPAPPYATPQLALPSSTGGCRTGSCGLPTPKLQPQGNTNMSPKSCCSSCATGSGQCSCSAESLGCAIGDTINQTAAFPATDATGHPTILGSCVLPPGFDNCLSYSGDLAPCDVDRIQRTRRRFVEIGDTTAGGLVDVTVALSTELDTPAGFSWYRLAVPEIDVAHQACPREFSLELNADVAGGGGIFVDVSATIEEVAIQSEAIFEDGDGNFVHAWSFPKPADPDDLKITDGRCACERLCDCVRYFGDAGISILAPTLPANAEYKLTTKGVRDCWQISCGACPPAKLCGREILA